MRGNTVQTMQYVLLAATARLGVSYIFQELNLRVCKIEEIEVVFFKFLIPEEIAHNEPDSCCRYLIQQRL